MKKVFTKIKKLWSQQSKKRKIFISSCVFVLVVVFTAPLFVSANVLAAGMAKIMVALIGIIAKVFSKIIEYEMQLFISFIQFNHFTRGIPAVEQGWIIMRDICNMFFILVLLVIAFSTILNYEAYSYKKWLGKLLIAAVVINFSKTIVGLMIDFSQVIMLTFVNAFKDIAMGNIITGLHLDGVFNIDYADVSSLTANSEAKVAAELVVTAAIALSMLAILAAILAMLIVIIVWRIVYLWVLIILSPLAFFLQATPFGSRYASKWWGELGKNLTTGPILAFFLYLSLYTIQSARTKDPVNGYIMNDLTPNNTALGNFDVDENQLATAGVKNSAMNVNSLFDFVVVIALLMTAMRITQESGVAGSKIAGNLTSKMSKYGKIGGKWAGRTVGRTARRVGLRTGSALTGGRRTVVGRTLRAWNQDLNESRNNKVRENRAKFFKKLGMGGRAQEQISRTLGTQGGRSTANVLKGIGNGAAVGATIGSIVPVFGTALGAIIGSVVGGGAGYINRNAVTRTEQASRSGSKREASITRETEKMNRQDTRGNYNYVAANKVSMIGEDGQQSQAQFRLLERLNDSPDEVAHVIASLDNPRLIPVPAPPVTVPLPADTAGVTAYRIAMNERQNIINLNSQAMRDFQAKMENMSKGIEAYRQGGGNTAGLQTLVTALDSRARGGVNNVFHNPNLVPDHPTNSGEFTYGDGLRASNQYANDVYAPVEFRKTGQEIVKDENIKGRTDFTGFGLKDEQGNYKSNTISLDFRDELKGLIPNIDTTASGAHITDKAQIEGISKIATSQIDAFLKTIQDRRESGEQIDKSDLYKESRLKDVKQRLSDPSQIKDLELINTGVQIDSMHERARTDVHEKAHRVFKDEGKAEAISNEIISKKEYASSDVLLRAAAELENSGKEFVSGEKEKGREDKQYNLEDLKEKIKTDNKTEERVSKVVESEKSSGDNGPEKGKSSEIDISDASIEKISKSFDDKSKTKSSLSQGAAPTNDLYQKEQERLKMAQSKEQSKQLGESNKLTKKQIEEDSARSTQMKTLNDSITTLEKRFDDLNNQENTKQK